jgi:hypothetical protein
MARDSRGVNTFEGILNSSEYGAILEPVIFVTLVIMGQTRRTWREGGGEWETNQSHFSQIGRSLFAAPPEIVPKW